jgi:hypothetical protein
MSQRFRNRPVLLVLLGLGLGLLVGIGMMVGTLTAVSSSQNAELMLPPTWPWLQDKSTKMSRAYLSWIT